MVTFVKVFRNIREKKFPNFIHSTLHIGTTKKATNDF